MIVPVTNVAAKLPPVIDYQLKLLPVLFTIFVSELKSDQVISFLKALAPIEVTFGGIELDLRRTTLAEGDTFLNINVVFGGVEITAPDNWDIEIRPNRFAGGIEDSRVKGLEKDRSRKLIIIAKCTFGGIDIK